VDGIIARIAAAQQPDGYLETFVQINVPDLRFKNFAFFHEDFSSGHLFEAALAHYQATGKKTLLTAATRLADLFAQQFGPGKQDYISGHEGIELARALVRRALLSGDDPPPMAERRYRGTVAADGGATAGRESQGAARAGQGRAASRSAGLCLRTSR